MDNQDIEKQLIGLAYSMALEPQRWHVMTGLMDQWMLGLVDENTHRHTCAAYRYALN